MCGAIVSACDSGSNTFVDVEAPREFVQLTIGKPWDIRRLSGNGGFHIGFFSACDGLFIVPEVKFAADKVEECMFDGNDEGLTVVLHKCERNTESCKPKSERCRKKRRKCAPEYVGNTQPTPHVYKLLEGEWSEDLILDLDELRYLELHGHRF